MLKRRIKKLTKALLKKVTGRKYLECHMCGEEIEVSNDTAKVTCGRCVHQLVEPPPNIKPKEKSDKPKGWHFKTYFEHDGKVYSKGVEVTDPKEISELKKAAGIVEKKPTKKKTTKKKTTIKKTARAKKRGK